MHLVQWYSAPTAGGHCQALVPHSPISIVFLMVAIFRACLVLHNWSLCMYNVYSTTQPNMNAIERLGNKGSTEGEGLLLLPTLEQKPMSANISMVLLLVGLVANIKLHFKQPRICYVYFNRMLSK